MVEFENTQEVLQRTSCLPSRRLVCDVKREIFCISRGENDRGGVEDDKVSKKERRAGLKTCAVAAEGIADKVKGWK